jgi:elongation factor Ts
VILPVEESMVVSPEAVKELRDKTGAGFMDCKRALLEASGDQEKAIALLRERGQAKAAKKRGRVATEGIIAHYVHADSKKAALVELNCETDFVARNAVFQELAREICMQVVAQAPLVVSRTALPKEVIESERAVHAQSEECTGKPAEVVEKIVEGKLEKFYERVCLLDQPYIRDEARKIRDLIDEAISKVGENMTVRRFVRMVVGEEQ